MTTTQGQNFSYTPSCITLIGSDYTDTLVGLDEVFRIATSPVPAKSEDSPLLQASNCSQPIKKPMARYHRWTKEEDELLSKAVEETTNSMPPFHWKKISNRYFHGIRSPQQCRSRWVRALNPTLTQAKWRQEEDELLLQMRLKEGRTFSEITTHFPGRRVEAVRERYQYHLDPSLRKDPWTKEEKKKLFRLVETRGRQWTHIAMSFPGRSDASCKNTWFNAQQSKRRMELRRQRAETEKNRPDVRSTQSLAQPVQVLYQRPH
eukprot:CAMPEP_0194206452 /NCGR_PEP_ID=MMETSP0156-20130528/5486_1 /TAXON_ID=33649 /ORGANISM="Thalassionema nitzschioides, Strain L26-B" /LENGTH=261 /DNA_ID=CAMNT_0038932981 /DNA_START=382 /DNA_END=1167 /DNA_ORIENTATION=+